jgi:hypothetical protein
MPTDIFLKLETRFGPIKGGSRHAKFRDWIAIESFSYVGSPAPQALAAGGNQRRERQSISLVKGIDQASTQMPLLVQSGESFLAVVAISGDGRDARSQWWAFHECVMDYFDPGDKYSPWESFTLSYGAIEHHMGDYQAANPPRPSGTAAIGAVAHGAVAANRNVAAKIAKAQKR